MNIRFKNAKILTTKDDHTFDIIDGELWVVGDEIAYVGDGSRVPAESPIAWDETRDCEGNLLMPGFKDAHTHTAMTFLRSYADDLPLGYHGVPYEWDHVELRHVLPPPDHCEGLE